MFTIDEIQWLKNEVDSFVQKQMTSYLALLKHRVENALLPASPKVLRDAVWGNISLSAAEVTLLDAPIIQRLRKIDNLGLASLIFPGATHSRFEHTLGVTYVAGKMASNLQQKYQPDINDQHLLLSPVELVRLAAIFHDTGHIFYSHTGERYFSSPSYTRSAMITETLAKMANHLKMSHISLGELLSALIMTSESIIELIRIAFSATAAFNTLDERKQHAKAKKIAYLAAELILGFSSKDNLSLYTGIINGPIDADKCDYLARDALQTGVPVLFDLERLIEKLVSVTIPTEKNGQHVQQTLGIHQSALASVEELTLSRRLMYEKVYYHPKVQTAETMLSEALRLIETSAPDFFSHFDHILRLNDHDLIHWEAKQALQDWAIRLNVPIINLNQLLQAGQLLEDIAKRQLLYRIIEIPERFLGKVPSIAYWCEYDIQPEIQYLIDLLDTEKFQTSPVILATASPKVTQITPNIWVDDGYAQTHYEDHITGISAQVRNTPIWLITSEDIAVYLIIAAEKQLWECYGLLLSSNDWQHLKVPYHAVQTVKETLYHLGYYHQSAAALLPLAEQLSDELTQVAQRYMPVFNLPFTQAKEKISTFLGQFRLLGIHDDLIAAQRSCLEWLKYIPMINETTQLTTIRQAYDQLGEPIRAQRQPLVYLSHQPVLDLHRIDLPAVVDFSELGNLLTENAKYIVFINNGALSVDDMTHQIKALFKKNPSAERNQLTPAQQEKLKSIPLYVLSGAIANAQASYSDPLLKKNIEYLSGYQAPLYSDEHLAYGEKMAGYLANTLLADTNQRQSIRHTEIIVDQFSSDSPAFLWQDVTLENGCHWRPLLPKPCN